MSKIKRRNTTDSKKNILNTQDSFVNFNQKMGMGADNVLSGSTYSLNNMISRNHVLLEAAYRSSWLVGAAVDSIAEDMTKEGVSFHSEMAPDDMAKLQVAINKFSCWEALSETIKWARLYGGALALPIIDGADYSKPLNENAIGKGKFKGILVLDRWMVDPNVGELVTELGQDFGKPKYYRIVPAVTGIPLLKIHYSRVFRFDGIKLPYYQRIAENMWGLSIVERMYDRLLAYDSSTTGAAQLLYKAYLRVIGVDGFREALAMGGDAENAVIKQFTLMRQMQSLEGITLLDKEDQFATHQYNFSGVSDLLIQFGEQISGATEIPLVRLFGQSPAGLSSTGESDLRNYYDAINKKQQSQLRPHCEKLFKIICISELGKELPKDFEFTFNPLWQTSDKENADIATVDSTTIINAHGSGLIKKSTALKELLQQSRVSGRFTNITDEEIKEAEEEEKNPPPNPFDDPDGNPPPKADEDNPDKKKALKSEEGENEVKAAKKSDMEPLAEHKKEEAQRKHETERDSAFEESDHPRDDDGKFVTSYHGSHQKNEEGILKEGIKRPLKGRTPGTVSVARRPDTAFGYAAMSGSGGESDFRSAGKKAFTTPLAERSVFKIKVPKEWHEKHLEGTVSEGGILEEYRYNADIPKEYITKSNRTGDISANDRISTKDKIDNLYKKVIDAPFNEQEHPREKGGENAGQFTSKGGGSLSSVSKEKTETKRTKSTQNFSETKRNDEGKLVSANGEALPEHIAKLKIPPAWKNVIYSEDKNSPMQAQGLDEKGRRQVIYNEKFKTKQTQAKFKRIEELNNKFDKILNENEQAISKGKEEAIITKLIMQTGIRPGSDNETGAKVKAYGATTLEGKHIIENEDGSVNLNFIGKKGVQNNIKVEDEELVKYLKEKAKNTDEKIFSADHTSLLNYVHTLDGGSFKTKDFRTLLGTKTAMAIVEKEEAPKTEKEYKKKVIAVAKQVAQKLGNTATVCLQAYINPSVFSQWQIS
jgi:hypothetical protein